MAQYRVEQSNLTKVANAIRGMGGTEEPLEFPDGFVNAIYNLEGGDGGLLMIKLWENASPTSAFAEQTLAIDWTPYDRIGVQYKWFYREAIAKKDEALYVSIILRGEDNTTKGAYRSGSIVDGGIYFDNATRLTTVWADKNDDLVPLAIYGIKGVIK